MAAHQAKDEAQRFSFLDGAIDLFTHVNDVLTNRRLQDDYEIAHTGKLEKESKAGGSNIDGVIYFYRRYMDQLVYFFPVHMGNVGTVFCPKRAGVWQRLQSACQERNNTVDLVQNVLNNVQKIDLSDYSAVKALDLFSNSAVEKFYYLHDGLEDPRRVEFLLPENDPVVGAFKAYVDFRTKNDLSGVAAFDRCLQMEGLSPNIELFIKTQRGWMLQAQEAVQKNRVRPGL